MRKGIAFVAVLAVAALTTGCTAGGRESEARDLCITAANEEIGQTVTVKDGTVSNMGDLLYDAGVKDSRETNDDNAMFTMTGEVTWKDGSTENRRSMLCTVTFEDGKAEPVELNLT